MVSAIRRIDLEKITCVCRKNKNVDYVFQSFGLVLFLSNHSDLLFLENGTFFVVDLQSWTEKLNYL